MPARQGEVGKTAYDVVDYDVPPDGPMVPARTLSRGWPVDLKPSDAGRIGPAAAPGPAVQSSR